MSGGCDEAENRGGGGASEEAPHLHDELRQRLSALRCEGREEGPHQSEVDEIIEWLFGYDAAGLQGVLDDRIDVETFVANAPSLNPNRSLITGLICGIRVEEIEEPVMREIRYLDKLIDELARGKKMEKILRA